MNIIGEIKQSTSFDWKIRDFFSLSTRTAKFYESPPFDFCNVTWCLVIYPNGSMLCEPCYVSIYLKKLNCQESIHTVLRKLSIKKSDGTDYIFCESEQEYVKNSLSWGKREFCERSRLLEDIHSKFAGGILTISCTVFSAHCVAETTTKNVSTEGRDKIFEEEDDNGVDKDVSSESKEVISTDIDSGKLIQDMETLFLNGQNSDVTLVVQDHKFPVHRGILGIRSPVFAAMFAHDLQEKTSGIVTIADFDPDVIRDFLRYLYTAKVQNFCLKIAVDLYTVADKYDTQELKIKCVEFMRDNLSLDMFCSVVSLALQHNESSLLEATTKFFVKNLKQIIVSVEWQAFMKENPAAANELHIKASDFYVPPNE